ncbi:MAG: HAD-IIB family hydrolase [Calditrichaeota bacterium]|nr:HAD-IIB family hydrolase [Calditrichota bacterium]
MSEEQSDPLYILLLSIHGLIRGTEIELGRDADTGGQVKYVVELAKKLAEDPRVGRVDLMTRQIFDPKVSDDYSVPEEQIGEKAFIIRIPCGPKRYLRKEVLWDYLAEFSDYAIQYFRKRGNVPDVVHGHYADGGYVGAQISRLLGVPYIFTGHSLGRVKKERLIENGMDLPKMEARYNIGKRIDGEEYALDVATMVVASTDQEIEEQYKFYENYNPKRMRVIPPGVDLENFSPPRRNMGRPQILDKVERFLVDARKPPILAISRADERKNIERLVHAYGQNHLLRDQANLVILAGNRDNISAMDSGTKRVLTNLLLLMDRYNLYGSMAIPKRHEPEDIPAIYRWAARQKGIFINPALTEPFGLTLLEAAASGLPIVATNDGGPIRIIGNCKNGLLIDPLNVDEISKTLQKLIEDRNLWNTYAGNGLKNVAKFYSWRSHVKSYLSSTRKILKSNDYKRTIVTESKSKLPTIEKLIITDIDNTLLGNPDGTARLVELIKRAGKKVGLGVATGRRVRSAVNILKEWNVPVPDLLITSVGSEIHYGKRLANDRAWKHHLNYKWKPARVREVLAELPGLKLQPQIDQREFKISYYLDPEKAPDKRAIIKHLRGNKLQTKVIHSHDSYLDILPIRASKGLAVRYLMMKWGLAPEQILVAGDSGNDEEMLIGNNLGVVVGNYSMELRHLHGKHKIYFAENTYADGIIEGIEYYKFLEEN